MDSEDVERDNKQRVMINWRELTRDEQIAALQNVAGKKYISPQFAIFFTKVYSNHTRLK